MQRLWVIMTLISVSVGFLIALNFYGTTLPLPMPPDEAVYIEPAKNLAEGKGMKVDAYDELLPGISQRAYFQVPVYFLTLSVWGKLFGFELEAVRNFSRVLGVVGLLLLFVLARRWGLTTGVSLLCVLWTALDLPYQYNANFARMDTLCAVSLIAGLICFDFALSKTDTRWFLLPGVFAALSVLTHLIAVPAFVVLAGTLIWKRRWTALAWFLSPLAMGLAAWFLYALQDWGAFVGQMTSIGLRKGERSWESRMAWFLFLFTWRSFLGLYPSNSPSPFWAVTAIMGFVAYWRRHFPIAGWQFAALGAAYLAAASGGEATYVGWFTPFGFLLVSLLSSKLAPRLLPHTALLCLAAAWTVYQTTQVFQAVASVKPMSHDTFRLYSDLTKILPKGSTILIVLAMPDPYWHLRKTRPDLSLYQVSPTPMRGRAWQRLIARTDFVIGIWPTLQWQWKGLPDRFDFRHRRIWSIRSPHQIFQIALVPARTLRWGNSSLSF